MPDPAEPLPCRVLPHSVGDGPSNMALDQALLDAVDADPTSAILRTYAWSAPTLSLGYFQPFEAARAEPRWRDLAIVRRPSGGGALLHDREVTYALVVPRSHPLAGRPSALYRAVHAAIAGRMASLGLDARRRGDSTRPGGPSPFLCFLDRDPEDVLLGGVKVVGSAQRRRPRAVLQHGSILLARSRFAEELPGVGDLAPDVAPGVDWAAEVRALLPGRLGLHPAPDGLRPAEEEASAHLARDIYATPGWTARR